MELAGIAARIVGVAGIDLIPSGQVFDDAFSGPGAFLTGQVLYIGVSVYVGKEALLQDPLVRKAVAAAKAQGDAEVACHGIPVFFHRQDGVSYGLVENGIRIVLLGRFVPDDDVVGRLVVGQKLSASVKDPAPLRRDGDLSADTGLELGQILVAPDDLQDVKAPDHQDRQKDHDNGKDGRTVLPEFSDLLFPCVLVISHRLTPDIPTPSCLHSSCPR